MTKPFLDFFGLGFAVCGVWDIPLGMSLTGPPLGFTGLFGRGRVYSIVAGRLSWVGCGCCTFCDTTGRGGWGVAGGVLGR